MLTIRLSRIGKKNKPMYRLIISEKARDPYGRALEILGSYNPYTKELQAKNERINYWLSQGSGMSPTVNNLLVEKGIIKGEKVRASKARKKKKDTKQKEQEHAKGEIKKDEKSKTSEEENKSEEKKDEKRDSEEKTEDTEDKKSENLNNDKSS